MKCVVWVFQVRKFHIPGKKTELLFDIAAFMQIVFIGIVKVKFLYGNEFVSDFKLLFRASSNNAYFAVI